MPGAPGAAPPGGVPDLSAEVVSALIAEALEPLHSSLLAMQAMLEARLPATEARSAPEPRTAVLPRTVTVETHHELQAGEGKMGTMAVASEVMPTSGIGALAETQQVAESLRVADDEVSKGRSFMLNPKMQNLSLWWEELTEPQRTGPLSRLVYSNAFSLLCSAVIMANTVYTAVVANWEMEHLGEGTPTTLKVMEWCFLGFFASELILRMAEHRAFFFVNNDWMWNNFDFVVVGVSLLGAVLDGAGFEGGDLSVARVLRFLKGARILRILRVLKVFRALATIVESFRRCAVAMFWCFAMLIFFLYIFALLFMNGVAGLLSSPAGRELDTKEYMEYFGNVITTMRGLFMTISGGIEWNTHYTLLVGVGDLYPVGFVAFVFLFVFAITNILTAIFVERAVEAALPDREEQVLRKRREMISEAAEFKRICALLDLDKTGTLSLDEFKLAMKNSVLVAYLASVGLAIHDVELFFRVVAGGSGETEIDIDVFVEGCMTMRGTASSLDVQQHMSKTREVLRRMRSFEQSCNEKMGQIIDRTDRLLSSIHSLEQGRNEKMGLIIDRSDRLLSSMLTFQGGATGSKGHAGSARGDDGDVVPN